MKTRLLKFIESQGMTAARFADEIGVQRSAVSHVLSDRNKPGYDFIYKILNRYQQLNAEWLIVGTGSMLKDFKQTSLFPDTNSSLTNNTDQNFVSGLKEEKDVLHDEPTPLYKKTEPVLPLRTEKKVEKIVFFYSDKSFTEFHPNNI